jgi:Mor family transcriptional regulator
LEKYKSLSLVSDLEKEIFFQHLKGYTYDELSKLYKIPRKKIDNIIRKVKGIVEGKNKIINP